MQFRVALLAILVCTALLLVGCGGIHSATPPVVHAAGPQCFPENFYNGVQETGDYLWFATDQACDIGTVQDQSYALKFDHSVQQMIVQMGSNSGSVFEWDLIVTFTRPDGRSYSTQQQYDKHSDGVGNRQITYNYPTPQFLPSGTVVSLHRRQLPSGYCLQAGAWGGGQACATGQSVQLIGVLK
jgi:hypothetical protein